MEEKKIEIQKVSTIPLIHNTELSYKIIIPESVEKKIRFLCKEIHNIEWSGVLFYDVEGNFEDGSLLVKCLDIYQMDIGNGAYTEYTMNPSVATYMLDHDLMTAYQGHIHSHHSMAAFFSGTDTNELRDGGKDTNHFVSLIVNNAGKYVAGITRKIESTSTIVEICKYSTFGDEVKTFEREYTEESKYLEWYKLQVEVHGQTIPFETEMLARIKEIRDEKSKATKTFSNVNYPQYKPVSQPSYPTTLPKMNTQKELPFEEETDIPYGRIHVDKKIVDSVIKQLITCSAIIPSESSLDISKWIKSMNTLYTKRFGNVKTFEEFAVNYVSFLIDNTKDESLVEVLDATDMSCILAYDVMIALTKYPSNPWLEAYIKLLDDFVL
jgi:proteasome lid subunit RPN8/RPN11